MSWFGHFWSLSVEEQFYLVWPVVLLLVARRGTAGLVPVLVAASVIPLLIRLATVHGTSTAHLVVGTHAIADQLAIGALMAVLLHRHPQPVTAVCGRLGWTAALLALVIVAVIERDSAGVAGVISNTVGIWVLAIATALVIGQVVTAPAATVHRTLSWRPLVAIGRISYGMYLWHILVLFLLIQHVTFGRQIEYYVAGLIVTIVVATLSWFAIERPFLRLKHRFEPPR